MLRRILLLLIIIVLSVPIAANLIAGSVPVRQTTINPDTINDLQLAERYGTGSMNEVVAFSPVDERIAVGSPRGIYILDHIDAEPQLIELFQSDEMPFNVTSLLFSPDGNNIFAGNGDEVLAYDLIEETIRYHLEDGEQVLSFNDDGSLLLYEMQHGVNVLDTESGEVVRVLSYDGIWERETTPEDDWEQVNTVISARFMADGERIIVKSYHLYTGGWEGRENIQTDIWTGESFERARYNDDSVPSYANNFEDAINDFGYNPEDISEDGRIYALLYRTRDEENIYYNQIGILNTETQEIVVIIPVVRSTDPLTLNHDGTLVAAGTNIYDATTGEHLHTFTVDTYEFVDSEYERILKYDADGTLSLLDAVTMNELTILAEMDDLVSQPVHYSNDPGYLWIRIRNENGLTAQQRFSLETGEIAGDFQSESINYNARIISPDKTYVVFGDSDLNRDIWYLETAIQLELPENSMLIAPYFSPDEDILLFNYENFEIWFYDVETGQTTAVFPVEIANQNIFHIAFAPDSQRVLIVQEIERWDENHVRVYDLTDTTTSIYEGNSHILEVDISDDGNYIALASDDLEVSVIDISTGETVFQQEVVNNLAYLSLTDNRLYINLAWEPSLTYDWQTGELYEPMPVLEQRPILTTDTMLFFRDDNRILRIAAADTVGLREIDLGREFTAIRLSEDGQRLWIDFTDGTVELWTIQS